MTAAFIGKTAALAESVRQPFDRPHGEGDYLLYQPHLGTLTISGPFDASGADGTPPRAGASSSAGRPAPRTEEAPCAQGNPLDAGAPRLAAAGRPPRIVDGLVRLLPRGPRRAAASRSGVERAVRALLVSPGLPVPRRVGTGWTIAPGDALPAERPGAGVAHLVLPLEQHPGRRAARRRRARAACGIPRWSKRQVRRMLADPRSEALAKNFAGQWLRLRNVSGALPSDVLFPELRGEPPPEDFVRETELFFDSVIRADRSVTELLTAGPYVPQRTACPALRRPRRLRQRFPARDADRPQSARPARPGQHPDRDLVSRPHVAGRPRQVGAGERPRDASAARRRPTCRSWSRTGDAGKALAMRERMEQHRANPVCASCHRHDGSARDSPWRTSTRSAAGAAHMPGGTAIDASGTMPDGDARSTVRRSCAGCWSRNPEQFVPPSSPKSC